MITQATLEQAILKISKSKKFIDLDKNQKQWHHTIALCLIKYAELDVSTYGKIMLILDSLPKNSSAFAQKVDALKTSGADVPSPTQELDSADAEMLDDL